MCLNFELEKTGLTVRTDQVPLFLNTAHIKSGSSEVTAELHEEAETKKEAASGKTGGGSK